MSTNSNLPNRQSIRLKNYDYTQAGSYFITLVSQDRLHLFGKIENGKMTLSPLGKILEEEWKKTIELRSNITLGEYIIMPDHMHMILTITNQMDKKEEKEWIHSNPKSPSQTIGAIIRGFKGASTKKINLFLNSTGELPFAPTTELPFAPTTELPFASTSEFQFAPTSESQFAPKNSQFAPTEFYTNKIFQRNYYEHIIRNQQDYNRIEQYILDNPKNWKKKKLKSKMNELT